MITTIYCICIAAVMIAFALAGIYDLLVQIKKLK